MATSTVAAKKLEEALAARGLSVQITQCKVSEVPFKAADCHLIVTTTVLGKVPGVPVVQTLSFLTGVGLDQDIQRIVDLLQS